MRDPSPPADRPVQVLGDLTDAASTWGHLCHRLEAGVDTPTHPFRWPVVGTVSLDGSPEVRVVVLRRFDESSLLLVFHTDVRTPKVAELRHNPRCGLLFYDPADRVQLRLRTSTTVHHADPFARAEFDALPPHVRASYASVGIPGADEAPDAPFDYPPKPPVDEAVAFAHFAAVACVVESADVLELHSSGHRRAALVWEEGKLSMKRIGP